MNVVDRSIRGGAALIVAFAAGACGPPGEGPANDAGPTASDAAAPPGTDAGSAGWDGGAPPSQDAAPGQNPNPGTDAAAGGSSDGSGGSGDASADAPACSPSGARPAGLLLQTGDPMPDCIGTIAQFEAPVVNNDGTVAAIVVAALDASVDRHNQYAIVLIDHGVATVVARGGAEIPGGGGTFQPAAADEIGPFRSAPKLTADGRVGFVGGYGVTLTTLEALGVFFGSPPGLMEARTTIRVHGAA